MKAQSAAALLASALISCALAADVTIQVGNPAGLTNPQKFQFAPRVIRVDPTDNVNFVFNGNHSVTQQSNFTLCTPGVTDAAAGATPFDSQVLSAGKNWTLPSAALAPGSIIYYYCKVGNGAHCNAPNFMQGALVVSGSNATGNGTASQPPPSGSTNPATPTDGSATSAAAATVTVAVGQGGNAFVPSLINAAPGDTVMFNWVGGFHDIVPSDAGQSCTASSKATTDPTLQALSSSPPKSTGSHSFLVPAAQEVGSKLWYFCSVGSHCSGDKMYGTINIVAAGSSGSSGDAPAPSNNGTTTTATTPQAGSAVAHTVGASFVILALVASSYLLL